MVKAHLVLLMSPLTSSSWRKKDEQGLGCSNQTRSACLAGQKEEVELLLRSVLRGVNNQGKRAI